MKANHTNRVLLMASEFASAKILRGEASRGLEIVGIESRGDLLREINHAQPAALVVESEATKGLPMSEVLGIAATASPAVPVVLLGEDGEDGRDAIQFIEEGAADYVPLSHVGRLPLVLRRLRREGEVLARNRELEVELRQACDTLIENQKLMSIGRLAASIAHEINNPLEAITNLLYLLRAEVDLSPAAAAYVETAEREMERVAQISKQTLNFYRETRTPVAVRPAELLDEVLVLYARRIAERRIEVARRYQSDATLLVFPGEMRQVLSNLVTNAIEASAMGGKLTLRVRKARKWSDEGITGIRIVVADNGSGIPVETRQHLGQLFYTTKGQRGTGLGLWVTRAILRRYGGDIHLYSSTREGRQGTVFSVFMPTNLRPQAVLTDSAPGGNGGGKGTRGVRISANGEPSSGAASSYGTDGGRGWRSYKRDKPPLVAS
jgi:signal transduction histidine kinase